MNTKSAKDFLETPQRIKNKIANLEAEKDQWESMAHSITALSENERVKASGNQQKMASAVDAYVDIENEIERQKEEYKKARAVFLSTVERLSPNKSDLLHKVYLLEMTIYEAAFAKGKSYSWAKATHRNALKEVQAILNEQKSEK